MWNRPISFLTACLQTHAVRLPLQHTVALVAAGGGKEEEEGGKKTRTAGLHSASKSCALLTVSSTAAVKHFATKDGHFLSGPQRSLISPLVCGWNMWKHLLSAQGHDGILRLFHYYHLFSLVEKYVQHNSTINPSGFFFFQIKKK